MTTVHELLDDYKEALTAGEERTVAERYAAPGLITSPGQPIAGSDERPTEQFAASAGAQDERVNDTPTEVAMRAPLS